MKKTKETTERDNRGGPKKETNSGLDKKIEKPTRVEKYLLTYIITYA